MQIMMSLFPKAWWNQLVDVASNVNAQTPKSSTHFTSNFLLSLLSMIYPAYKDSVTAGIASANPIMPM